MPAPGCSTADSTRINADCTYLNASDTAIPYFDGEPANLLIKAAEATAANSRAFCIVNSVVGSNQVY